MTTTGPSGAPAAIAGRRTARRAALTIERLTKRFDGGDAVTAVDGVDLTVADGAVTAVLGPSGCGKTTLLRLVAGIERPDLGRITIGGSVAVDVRTAGVRAGMWVPPERRRIGLVPQEGALFPHLDVAANVAFGIRSLPQAERRARVEELLDLVSLGGHGARRPHELSGGQRQRVALARALAPRPEVVLMDEPFAALDATLRARLGEEVVTLLRRSGATAVIVTHDRSEAMALADEIAVMRAGRIVQLGRPEDLYLHPVDEWTARFLGDAVLVPGRVVDDATGRWVECALGRFGVTDSETSGDGADGGSADSTASDSTTSDRRTGSDVTVLLRPEQIVRAGSVDLGGTGPPIDARVTATQFLGPEVVVGLAVQDAIITARWPSSLGRPMVGDHVTLMVVGRVRVLPPTVAPEFETSAR